MSTSPLTSALGPFAVFQSAWKNRRLIARLAEREIHSRYRGTLLGLVWSVLVPLLLLAVYTFVFSVVFQARWANNVDNKGEFAIILFSGLLLFNLFAECITRAPTLLLSNVMYIKKVVFPLEILPWVILLAALFNALISFIVLFVGYVCIIGMPPLTVLFLPLLMVPLVLLTLGVTHFLSSVGVFIRDLQPLIGIVVMIVMFLSPIFYPLSSIPAHFRVIVQLSPVTLAIEGARDALFWGKTPDLVTWVIYFFAAWLTSWVGYAWFMKTRKGFADVV